MSFYFFCNTLYWDCWLVAKWQ